jgi:hypothetical protein
LENVAAGGNGGGRESRDAFRFGRGRRDHVQLDACTLKRGAGVFDARQKVEAFARRGLRAQDRLAAGVFLAVEKLRNTLERLCGPIRWPDTDDGQVSGGEAGGATEDKQEEGEASGSLQDVCQQQRAREAYSSQIFW